MFTKVLIANRGEIAVRVMRACRELGIRTVAVYSDADRDAVHTHFADEAVGIGGPEARTSYLDIAKLIDAAKMTGAQALHPGYGFLSERPALAQACVDAGIVFVGPPAAVIESMGDKIRARDIMQKAGVPVVPSSRDPDPAKAAREIGFPVLLKAAAGGGGKGMRKVTKESELQPGIEAAAREAQNAFGDPRIFVERYVEKPRHVEVQVLADTHGNVVHLFERDCSMQRRHQKVLEESPCPVIDEAQRERMTQAAVTAARAAGYVNAGTVEFILAPDGAFYFLEMNTRLQVEHPVTEQVLGIDLVAWQLRVAAGEKLDPRLATLTPRGHAIEARVYAEDPERGFLPCAGHVLVLEEPKGPGVRVDSGIREGTEVTSLYDPLLAKLTCWGEDREAARRRLVRALADYRVLGMRTNLDFLGAVVASADFAENRYDTHYLEEKWKPVEPSDEEVELALAAVLLAGNRGTGAGSSKGSAGAGSNEIASPWTTMGPKRFTET